MWAEWNAIDISMGFCVVLLRLDVVRSANRVAWIGVAILCLGAIYFTYTRAAWLGLLLGGVPLFWRMSEARGMTVRRRAMFLGTAIGFAALVLFLPSDMLRNRATDSGTIYFRFSIWIAGLEMMAQNPILGVGFGQFAPNLGAHLRDLVWIPPADAAQEGTLAHNTFISVGAEFGLLGLALYVGLLVGVYKAARTAASNAWGRLGACWVDGYILVYLINIQFITAHKLASNLLFFGIMGAVAGMRSARPAVASPGVVPEVAPRMASTAQ
jgi:O-antigen ligase